MRKMLNQSKSINHSVSPQVASKIATVNTELPKQITEFNVPYDPNNCEAFLYKFTNLNNNKVYIGIHKGKPFDGYMFSSENEEFHSDFMNPNAKFKYEVLYYGSYEYMGAVEQNLLQEVNAKDNPLYYNNSNGGSNIVLPNINKLKYIVESIQNEKSYEGAQVVYTPVKQLPGNRLQIREFTKDPAHVSKLKGIINDKSSLEHLLVVILKNRLYRGQLGDLVVDGNHSIEATEESKFGKSGMIPTVTFAEHLHKDLTDDEVDILALMFNPREENPRLQSTPEDIARQVCNLKLKGIDTGSKEVQDLYHYFHLTKAEKTKVSKIANEMYLEIKPNHTTWIDYGAGDEKKTILGIIKTETVSVFNNSGIFSKCYSTAKYNPWSDIYDIILWNKDNPHNKIHTYRVRWYHKDKDYKDIWEKKWKSNNEYVIDEILGKHNIKRDWIYLPETRDKLTRKGGR